MGIFRHDVSRSIRKWCSIGTLAPALVFFSASSVRAHDTMPTTPVTLATDAILAKLQMKLVDGVQTEAGLADEIKALDALFEKYRSQKTLDVAHILIAKISVYLEILDDVPKAQALLEQLKREFP